MDGFLIRLNKFIDDTENERIGLVNELHDAARKLVRITKSEDSFLYFVDKARKAIINSSLEEYGKEGSYYSLTDRHIAAIVAQNKSHILINEICSIANEFPHGISFSCSQATNILCLPLLKKNGECIAVFELFRENHNFYTRNDVKIALKTIEWIGLAFDQNIEKVFYEIETDRIERLRNLLRNYFAQVSTFKNYITETMKIAKELLKVNTIRFFEVISKEDKMIVFADRYDEETDPGGHIVMVKKKLNIKFHNDTGIVGKVLTTGKTLNQNYVDTMKSGRDNQSLFEVQTVLCVPINFNDEVIGAIELVNKRDGKDYFDEAEETIAEQIAIFCALAMHYNRSCKIREQMDAKNEVWKSILTHQITRRITELDLPEYIEPEIPDKFTEFDWYLPPDARNDMVPLACYMINLICASLIKDISLIYKFITNVKKCYRDIPFHNFFHGFDTLHGMFCVLIRNTYFFSVVEMFALMLAALCNCIDHQGFSNNFIRAIKHPLTLIYENSYLENHRSEFGKLLIKKSEILSHLEEDVVETILTIFKDVIMTNNIPSLNVSVAKLGKLLEDGHFRPENQKHRSHLFTLLFSAACDSCYSKSFPIAKSLSYNLYKEFIMQGEAEKEANIKTTDFTDVDQIHLIPQKELAYLNDVTVPCLSVLQKVFPVLQQPFTLCNELEEACKSIIELQGKKSWRPDESIGRQFDARK